MKILKILEEIFSHFFPNRHRAHVNDLAHRGQCVALPATNRAGENLQFQLLLSSDGGARCRDVFEHGDASLGVAAVGVAALHVPLELLQNRRIFVESPKAFAEARGEDKNAGLGCALLLHERVQVFLKFVDDDDGLRVHDAVGVMDALHDGRFAEEQFSNAVVAVL